MNSETTKFKIKRDNLIAITIHGKDSDTLVIKSKSKKLINDAKERIYRIDGATFKVSEINEDRYGFYRITIRGLDKSYTIIVKNWIMFGVLYKYYDDTKILRRIFPNYSPPQVLKGEVSGLV